MLPSDFPKWRLAANKVCRRGGSASALTIIRKARGNVVLLTHGAVAMVTNLSTIAPSKALMESCEKPVRLFQENAKSNVTS
jgi:hypothetical protein